MTIIILHSRNYRSTNDKLVYLKRGDSLKLVGEGLTTFFECVTNEGLTVFVDKDCATKKTVGLS
jgi:hypothetical protein